MNLANSLLQESFYDGTLTWNSQLNATNCVFLGIDRAVSNQEGSSNRLVNCTLADNRIGLFVHGGRFEVANSIIANSLEAGVLDIYGLDQSVLRFCDVWNPQAKSGNYSGTRNQTGQNGNISADPKFKHPERDNYRLNFGSPSINAGDAAAALVSDFMGAPRYTDPRSPHTGVPGLGGVYADMGAFEFVENAESDLDLIVTWVDGPSEIVAGQRAKVQWQVMNAGTGQAIGLWHDAISLVADSSHTGCREDQYQ